MNFMMVFRGVIERNKNLKYQKICLRRLSIINKDMFDSNIQRNIIYRLLDREILKVVFSVPGDFSPLTTLGATSHKFQPSTSIL